MEFQEFWPIYLSKHSRRGTKLFHAVGLILGYAVALCAVLSGELWYAFAAPMIGYFCAFSGHYWIEGNTPASFGNPVLSFVADHKMVYLMLRGRL